MAGTKEGAAKAHLTRLKKDKNYYANIGKKSWQDPDRSKLTGFALLEEEVRKTLGRKGGLKTKEDYKPTEVNQISSESGE